MSTLEETGVDLSQVGAQMLAPGGDPFRPADLVVAPGVAQAPPCCPRCLALLQPMNTNAASDVLFECMNDGYQAVYRNAKNDWEQRPGAELKRWTQPLTVAEARAQQAQRFVPAPRPLATPDPNARPYDDWMKDGRRG